MRKPASERRYCSEDWPEVRLLMSWKASLQEGVAALRLTVLPGSPAWGSNREGRYALWQHGGHNPDHRDSELEREVRDLLRGLDRGRR